jgi:hypothetical protein
LTIETPLRVFFVFLQDFFAARRTSLIADRAACFASRLAGGLAFAASDLLNIVLTTLGYGFNVLHCFSPNIFLHYSAKRLLLQGNLGAHTQSA